MFQITLIWSPSVCHNVFVFSEFFTGQKSLVLRFVKVRQMYEIIFHGKRFVVGQIHPERLTNEMVVSKTKHCFSFQGTDSLGMI